MAEEKIANKGGAAIRWDDGADRDLAIALVLALEGEKSSGIPWDIVEQKMASVGYNFTRSAMSQHWSKKVAKSFRARMEEGGGPAVAAPKPRPRPAAGLKRSRKKAAAQEEPANSQDAAGDPNDDEAPPAKRACAAPKQKAPVTKLIVPKMEDDEEDDHVPWLDHEDFGY